MTGKYFVVDCLDMDPDSGEDYEYGMDQGSDFYNYTDDRLWDTTSTQLVFDWKTAAEIAENFVRNPKSKSKTDEANWKKMANVIIYDAKGKHLETKTVGAKVLTKTFVEWED